MPGNVFQFVSNTIIDKLGTIELRINSWEASALGSHVEIVLDEMDASIFENRESFSRRGVPAESHQLSDLTWNYIGKIVCDGGIARNGGYYFVNPTRTLERQSARRPIPFNLRIPTGSGQDDQQDFTFWVTSDAENRYEVAVKITTSDNTNRLAPSEGNKHMIFGVKGRIVLPRFFEIVQPYYISNWDPQTTRASTLSTDDMAQRCLSYITPRLNNRTAIQTLLNHSEYRSAEPSGQEDWVRKVIEHMTGLVYAYGQRAYGGTNEDWRQRLRTLGEYPACNVCDQLGSVIQWIRGFPDEGGGPRVPDLPNEDYIWGGFRTHINRYRDWAGTIDEAVFFDTLTGANGAISNIEQWAKPGASIFYHRYDSSPEHETTIIRTRGQDDNLRVQLFDYGLNLRGSLGDPNPPHVAQESGWIPPRNVLRMLRGGDSRFWAVGWRPSGAIRNPQAALGDVKLYVYPRRESEQPQEPTLDRRQLHGREEGRDPNKIYPITHFINALSGMPYADQIIAKFRVESTPVFASGGRRTPLLDIITESNGKVRVNPFPDGNPFR